MSQGNNSQLAGILNLIGAVRAVDKSVDLNPVFLRAFAFEWCARMVCLFYGSEDPRVMLEIR